MEQFYTVLTQITIFAFLIILGMIAVKCRMLDEHSLGGLSRIVMRMALPAYIFINTAEGATREGLAASLTIVPLTIVLYILLYLLGSGIVRALHLSGNRRQVFRALLMFGNVGFMGIPLVTELYPDTALIYISLFTILDQSFFWCYGVTLTMPVEVGRNEMHGFSSARLKNLLSPALIAIVAATVMVLFNVHLPSVLTTTLTRLGSACMPMSLIYTGGMLCMTDIRKVLRCGELYAQIGFKMILLPLAMYAVLHAIGIPADMAGTISFIAGLPSISLVAMLAKNNGSDGEYTVCAVMLSTIACLVTLPLVSLGFAFIG